MVTNGTTRQACAADPTAGLLPALGRGAVAAVVGVNREPDIGLGGGSSVTGAAASTVALARQAALAGLPTIAVCLPASSASDTKMRTTGRWPQRRRPWRWLVEALCDTTSSD